MIDIETIKKRITISNAYKANMLSEEENIITINVAEQDEVINPTVNLPLLSKDNWLNYSHLLIPEERLSAIAAIIDYFLQHTNKNINLNCTAGIERSPLCLAWYLHIYNNLSLKKAYKIIKEIRPEAEERSFWIKYNNLESYYIHTKE